MPRNKPATEASLDVAASAESDAATAEAQAEKNPNQITIAGKPYEVTSPYAAGHTLTEGEASQMNQLRHEHVRNNMARKLKELDAAGTLDESEAQRLVSEYDAAFQFGVRQGGGGRVADPVKREALLIATETVKRAIRKKGLKVADYEASAIREKAQGLIDSNPQLMELARTRVEEAKALGDVDVGLDAPDQLETVDEVSEVA